MTYKEAKAHIDKTGEAFLTLSNDNEFIFVGQVDTVTIKDGRIKLSWKLPTAEHISSFDRAIVHDGKIVLFQEQINPLRLDIGTKKYEVNWDV